jgi:hypothetical protein
MTAAKSASPRAMRRSAARPVVASTATSSTHSSSSYSACRELAGAVPVEISPASVWWSVPPVAVTDLPWRPSSARKSCSVTFAEATTAASPDSNSIVFGSAEVSMTASEATILEQECRLPGTRTAPFASSPEWMRSSMAFSSSMLVGRSTRSGRNETSCAQSSITGPAGAFTGSRPVERP